ncbi:MAG: hypothetical protein KJP04_04835 [Arenicella sp.]|nr:hypothetical protein [Arenicella sp.]
MFKQVFRITFITFVWKQYKRAIVSTALLFGYLYLVGSLHEDYLNYAELEQGADVGFSFIMKWSALLLGVMVYFVYHFLRRSKSERADGKSPEPTLPGDENDPFAEIRKRKKLRSKAEMIIDKESKD